MLRTSPLATEHDTLVSLSASHTLAQIVRKADKSFKRQLSRCPDIRAFSVSMTKLRLLRDLPPLQDSVELGEGNATCICCQTARVRAPESCVDLVDFDVLASVQTGGKARSVVGLPGLGK
jgi:hypothetical protein